LNRRYLPLVMLACALTVGLFIGLNFPSPDLYVPENHSYSVYHQNPELLEMAPSESSEMILELMEQLMDDTGTVVLNIKVRDFETAEKDLALLLREVRSFDNMVVNLELSETEIGEFSRYSRRNTELIQRLLEENQRYAELQSLSIKYRDERNPSALYSVTYEGEGLKTKIQEISRQYNAQAPALTTLGTQFNLNTSRYLQSVSVAETLAEEVGTTQQTRKAEADSLKRTAPPSPESGGVDSVLVELQPETASFGQVIQVTAWLNGREVAGKAVDLFVDSDRWAAGRSDASGRFSYRLVVDRIRAERHVMYAAQGGIYSPVLNFSITSLDPDFTLDVPERSGPNVTIRGTLTAAGRPVGGAEVHVLVDGYLTRPVITRSDGTIQSTLRLGPGSYQVMGSFQDTTFPLNPRMTSAHPVTVGEEVSLQSLITTIMIYATFLILFSMGAVVYYRHGKGGEPLFNLKNPFAFLKFSRKKDEPQEKGVVPPAAGAPPRKQEGPAPPDDRKAALEEPAHSQDWAIAQFRQLMIGGDLQNAVHGLYLHLRDRMGRTYRIRNHKALTPRELWKFATDRPYFGDLTKFIHGYEMIRYGRMVPSAQEAEALLQWFSATSSAIERDHD